MKSIFSFRLPYVISNHLIFAVDLSEIGSTQYSCTFEGELVEFIYNFASIHLAIVSET